MEDRSKHVSELLKVLMDINVMNGGNTDTAEKMKLHAKNFESALYAKSSSKKEYLDSMQEKVSAMRNTRDARQKAIDQRTDQMNMQRSQQQQQQQASF